MRSTASTSEITKLAQADMQRASDVLGQAFYDDPLMIHVAPSPEQRKRLASWFIISVRYGYLYGEVYTTKDVEGVAIWIPPGNYAINLTRIIRTGMIAIPFRVGFAPFMRILSAFTYQEKLHKQDAPPNHWYLFFLGVTPSQQRHGIGSNLIQPALRRADTEKMVCYLETTRESNIAFYNKHQFDVIREFDLPGGGPRCWTMRRDPRRS